jgi:hypothetical protein
MVQGCCDASTSTVAEPTTTTTTRPSTLPVTTKESTTKASTTKKSTTTTRKTTTTTAIPSTQEPCTLSVQGDADGVANCDFSGVQTAEKYNEWLANHAGGIATSSTGEQGLHILYLWNKLDVAMMC